MNKAKTQLKKAWEDNPQGVIMMSAIAAGAAATLINAVTGARNARTWSKEVNRRTKKAN